MGHVILPSGDTTWVNELKGSVNLSELVSDMKQNDYTEAYRICVIAAVAKLGNKAAVVIPYLKDLVSSSEINISSAAKIAIKKIEEGGGISVDNRYQKNNFYNGAHYNTGINHTSTSTYVKRPEPSKVEFTEIMDANELHEGLIHYCRCTFCGKDCKVNSNLRQYSDRLNGKDNFFCINCIRNDYNVRGKNILVLTYRGLIGYYYYAYYITPKVPSLTVIDIVDTIELHAKIGLMNPVFRYDHETYNWFIDFSKIGKRKLTVDSILKTIIEQLACFNIYENVPGSSPRKLYEKYKSEITRFDQDRSADGVFAPTLWGCDIPVRCKSGTSAVPVNLLQGFVPSSMISDSNRTSRRFTG